MVKLNEVIGFSVFLVGMGLLVGGAWFAFGSGASCMAAGLSVMWLATIPSKNSVDS